MSHFIEVCKFCGVVITQCRCIDPNKEKRYGVCVKCAAQQLLAADGAYCTCKEPYALTDVCSKCGKKVFRPVANANRSTAVWHLKEETMNNQMKTETVTTIAAYFFKENVIKIDYDTWQNDKLSSQPLNSQVIYLSVDQAGDLLMSLAESIRLAGVK